MTYDSEVDVLRVLFSDARIEESDEDKPGVILDYDAAGLSAKIRRRMGIKSHEWTC